MKASNHSIETEVKAGNGVSVKVVTRHIVGTFTTSVITSSEAGDSRVEVDSTRDAKAAIAFHNQAVNCVKWIVRRDMEKTAERIAGEVFSQKVTRGFIK